MSRIWTLSCVLVASLSAQEPAVSAATAVVPDTLAGALSAVVRGHPDVLLAEAKLRQAEALVRQAEAEVMQARLRATRETVALWNERRAAEVEHETASTLLKTQAILVDKGQVSATDYRATEERAAKAAVALDASRAVLSGLVATIARGPKSSAADPSLVARLSRAATTSAGGDAAPTAQTAPPPPRRPALPPALTTLLERRIDVSCEELPLPEAARKILGDLPVNLVLEPSLRESLQDHRVTLSLKQVTTQAALTALVDQSDYAFILRDYGLRLTGVSQAITIDAPALPESLPLER